MHLNVPILSILQIKIVDNLGVIIENAFSHPHAKTMCYAYFLIILYTPMKNNNNKDYQKVLKFKTIENENA